MAAVTATALVGAATVANSAYQGHEARSDARSQNRANAWIGEASQDAVGRARMIADRPYEGYEGDRVAELSQNQAQAIGMARTGVNSGESRAMLDRSTQLTDQVAGSEWNEDTAKKYMDPYIGQVVNNSLSREKDAYDKRMNQVRGNAARSGAFGGDRATLLESSETDAHLRNVGEITASGYSDAFKQASSTWQADNQRRTSAASAYRAAGADINNMNSSQITDLLRTGQVDQVLRQAGADFDYQQFIENRDWDANNLQPLLSATNAARGSPTTPVPRDQTAGQLLGLASVLTGYFGQQSGQGGYQASLTQDAPIGMAAGGDMPVWRPTIGD